MKRSVVLALWLCWSLNLCLVNSQQLCEADVVFVLDSSGSIEEEDFAKAISFTQRVVGTVLEIGPDSSLVGAIRFSSCDSISAVVPLGSSTTKSGVISQLGAISYDAGGTCTGDGINAGSNMLQGSARTDAVGIMLVLTDGKSTQGANPCSAAQSAHAQNISMIAVGVGPNTDQSELNCIGIDGSFSVDNFDELQTILNDLVVCFKCGPDITQWLINRLNSDVHHALVESSSEYSRWANAIPGFNLGWTFGIGAQYVILVYTNGEWDFKNTQTFATDDCPDDEHCKGKVTLCGQCFDNDLTGNIHYGYMTAVMKLLPDTIWHIGAGLVQQTDDWPRDAPEDIEAINVGQELYYGTDKVLCNVVAKFADGLNKKDTGQCEPCYDVYQDTPKSQDLLEVDEGHKGAPWKFLESGKNYSAPVKVAPDHVLLQTGCEHVPNLVRDPAATPWCDQYEDGFITEDMILQDPGICVDIPSDFPCIGDALCGCQSAIPGAYPLVLDPIPPILTVEEQTGGSPTVINDICNNAQNLPLDTPIAGTTTNATFETLFCGPPTDSAGVWYRVVGDGNMLEATTCNTANFDTRLKVFSEGCAVLQCVGFNDDGIGCSGLTSSISWISECEPYWILVEGTEGGTGNFTLSVVSSGNDTQCAPQDNLNLRAGDASPIEYNNIELTPALDECTSFKYDAMLDLQCGMGYSFTADNLNAVNLTCTATYSVKLVLENGTPENSQKDALFEGDVKGTHGKSQNDVLVENDVINVEQDQGPNIGMGGSPSPPPSPSSSPSSSNPAPPSNPSPSSSSSNQTPPSFHIDLPTSVTFGSFQLDFDVIQGSGAEGFAGDIFFSVDEECELEASQTADNDIVLSTTCLVELVADEVCQENDAHASMFSGLVPLGLLNLEHGEIGIGIGDASNSSPPPSPPPPPSHTNPSPPSPPSTPTSDADINCVSAGQISPSVPTPSGEGIAISSLTTFNSTLEESRCGTTPSPPGPPSSIG